MTDAVQQNNTENIQLKKQTTQIQQNRTTLVWSLLTTLGQEFN